MLYFFSYFHHRLFSSYRKSDKLIVTDGRNLAYFPANEEHHFTDFSTRQLRASEPEDLKIIRRLIEKALELSIKRVTGHRKMHGIFLLEEPIPLYRCEKARLYLGFSASVSIQDNHAVIEWTPQAYIRESVLDYVQLRRERGASASVIDRFLTTYRNRVIVAGFIWTPGIWTPEIWTPGNICFNVCPPGLASLINSSYRYCPECPEIIATSKTKFFCILGIAYIYYFQLVLIK